jgi:K+-transporting ATPase ATPase C chain
MKYITKSIWLLLFAVVLGCGVYPALLWAIGQTVFPFQANGSMVKDQDGHVVGSLLIAQPFTKDEYFQPRPSACSYDGSASSSSAIAASNYALRNRVATTLGPIVTYKGGAKDGKPVAPDIEAWFQLDQFQGGSNIVAQWADAHNSVAQGWVTGDPSHTAYVSNWAIAHAPIVAQFIKDSRSRAISRWCSSRISRRITRASSRRRSRPTGPMASPSRTFSRSRKARIYSRPSSICGVRTTRTWRFRTCPATW